MAEQGSQRIWSNKIYESSIARGNKKPKYWKYLRIKFWFTPTENSIGSYEKKWNISRRWSRKVWELNTLESVSFCITPCLEQKPAATNTWRSISVHVKGFKDFFHTSRAGTSLSSFRMMKVRYERRSFLHIVKAENNEQTCRTIW